MSDDRTDPAPEPDGRESDGQGPRRAEGEDTAPPSGDDAPRSEAGAPSSSPSSAAAPASVVPVYRPNLTFLVVVSLISLVADLGTKAWAKARLDDPSALVPPRVEVISEHLWFVFARNKGGAFGLLQDENEALRRPFFLIISVAAVVFIVSLYRKLTPGQTALKWGLPLVLGGALGNLVDRVRYGFVIDFIDFRADWVRPVNAIVAGARASDHWPTFNVADIAIVAGVALMAIDMFTSRKPAAKDAPAPPSDAPPPGGEPGPRAS